MAEKFITETELEERLRIILKKINSKAALLQTYSETLSGNKTLKVHDPKMQFLDPNGANRTITLPAEAISDGVIFHFFNMADGAEDLIIEDDGSNTIITVSQNESGLVGCNGSFWKGLVGGVT